MKFGVIFLIFFCNTCFAQQWQAEAMAGVSGYNGDLTRRPLSLRSLGPAINLNIKYMLPGNFVVLRAGIGYGRISGNDKNNSNPVLKERNLNFKTHILEGHIGAELNILDPESFDAFPYLFVGLGIFHFDPYTKDRNNNKAFLRNLGTEGQGLEQSPKKKMYSLTQFCIPIGGGWKWKINDSYEVAYELGARYLLTDYLDDVSTAYANLQALQAERGRIAAELSYRQNNAVTDIEGKQRGNPKIKDWYYFTGVKFIINLGANLP
ncbi:MAG: DUF6089 family protein [Ferruginibacter sp.]